MSEIELASNSSGIYLSVSAADKVAELIRAEDKPLYLRVSITGGGCSGFQYVFSFDEIINDDDTVITQFCSDGKESVKLLVDCMSYPFFSEAEIDYEQGIRGEQFVVRNPNAKTTCGCGSSFSIEEDE